MRRLTLAFRALFSAALIAAGAPPSADAWVAQRGGSAGTTTTQVLMGLYNSNLSNSADRYSPLGFSSGGSTTDQIFTVFPVPGRITTLRLKLATPPTTGSHQILLRKNGVDTALTCTITSASSPSGTCSATGSISFAAGDYASLRLHPSGTPTLSTASHSAVFTPTTANDTILPGHGAGFNTSTTLAINGLALSSPPGTPANRRNNVFPDGGTIDKFYVATNAPGTPASGQSYAYTVDKNTVTQTLTCSIVEDATACNDTTHSFSITGASGTTAGDDVQMQGAPTGTPAAATGSLAVRYIPTTAGSYPLQTSGGGTNNNASTTYYGMSGTSGLGSTTESNQQTVTEAQTFTKMAVRLSAAPGAGKSRAYTLMVNGSPSALTCTVSNTDTVCTGTGTVAVSANDVLDTSDVPSGTPANSQPAISYLAHQ